MTPPPLPCSRCHTAIEKGDLRCPVCYLAVPAIERDPGAGVSVEVLRCGGCGAAMAYQAKAQAPQCAFCGGVLKLEQRVDPEERAGSLLPFRVDSARATEIYHQWISRQGFFRPSNLASAAQLESLRPIWWVAWVVDAKALVTWTADSDAGAKEAKWAPQAGEFQSEFDDLVIPASRGLSLHECACLVPSYDHRSAFDPAGDSNPVPAGTLEQFEISRSVAREQIVGAIQRLTDVRLQGGEIPGSRFRNVHSSIQLRGLVTRRMGFPAYVLAYRYRGRLHRTVISGQDPGCVIGEAPRSVARLVGVIALILVGLVGVILGLLKIAR